MKQVLALAFLLFATTSVSAEISPTATETNNDAVLYSTQMDTTAVNDFSDEPMMCTMEYAPVCGVNGKTYGNSCTAWKNKVAYTGECNVHLDVAAYQKLETTKTNILKKQLSKFSTEKLNLWLLNIEKAIKMVEVSRIAPAVQSERITFFMFVKNTVLTVLQSR